MEVGGRDIAGLCCKDEETRSRILATRMLDAYKVR